MPAYLHNLHDVQEAEDLTLIVVTDEAAKRARKYITPLEDKLESMHIQ